MLSQFDKVYLLCMCLKNENTEKWKRNWQVSMSLKSKIVTQKSRRHYDLGTCPTENRHAKIRRILTKCQPSKHSVRKIIAWSMVSMYFHHMIDLLLEDFPVSFTRKHVLLHFDKYWKKNCLPSKVKVNKKNHEIILKIIFIKYY